MAVCEQCDRDYYDFNDVGDGLCPTCTDEYAGEACDRCQGDGEVPTADYESYFGAMMKPCPKCYGKLDGLGHGRLS